MCCASAQIPCICGDGCKWATSQALRSCVIDCGKSVCDAVCACENLGLSPVQEHPELPIQKKRTLSTVQWQRAMSCWQCSFGPAYSFLWLHKDTHICPWYATVKLHIALKECLMYVGECVFKSQGSDKALFQNRFSFVTNIRGFGQQNLAWVCF